jgi:hypothetical protein
MNNYSKDHSIGIVKRSYYELWVCAIMLTIALRGGSRSASKFGLVMGNSGKHFIKIGAASWGEDSWKEYFLFYFRGDNRI